MNPEGLFIKCLAVYSAIVGTVSMLWQLYFLWKNKKDDSLVGLVKKLPEPIKPQIDPETGEEYYLLPRPGAGTS